MAAGLPLDDIWLELDARIYAFHMPLFFSLSGWFYIRSIANRGFADFAVLRFERILYPMVLWTYVFFICKFLAAEYVNTPVGLNEIPLIPIPGVLHFWFLWDLLVLSFLAYPLRFALRDGGIRPSVWVLAVAILIGLRLLPLPSAAVPWIGTTLYYAPFFLFGVALGQTREIERPAPSGLIALAVVFSVVLLFWSALAQSEYRSIASFVLVVCALGLLFGLEPRYPDWLRSSLSMLGVASMTIYLAHTIFSAAFREALLSFGVTNAPVHIVVGTVAGIVGPLALLALARRFGIARALGLEIAAVPLRKKSSDAA